MALKQTDYSMLLAQTKSLIEGEPLLLPNMANTAALLYHALEEINWLGFYFLKEEEEESYLSLGPFMGQTASLPSHSNRTGSLWYCSEGTKNNQCSGCSRIPGTYCL